MNDKKREKNLDKGIIIQSVSTTNSSPGVEYVDVSVERVEGSPPAGFAVDWKGHLGDDEYIAVFELTMPNWAYDKNNIDDKDSSLLHINVKVEAHPRSEFIKAKMKLKVTDKDFDGFDVWIKDPVRATTKYKYQFRKTSIIGGH